MKTNLVLSLYCHYLVIQNPNSQKQLNQKKEQEIYNKLYFKFSITQITNQILKKS